MAASDHFLLSRPAPGQFLVLGKHIDLKCEPRVIVADMYLPRRFAKFLPEGSCRRYAD